MGQRGQFLSLLGFRLQPQFPRIVGSSQRKISGSSDIPGENGSGAGQALCVWASVNLHLSSVVSREMDWQEPRSRRQG